LKQSQNISEATTSIDLSCILQIEPTLGILHMLAKT